MKIKNKLVKTGHKKSYYVTRKVSFVSLCCCFAAAAVIVPITCQFVEYAKAEKEEKASETVVENDTTTELLAY